MVSTGMVRSELGGVGKIEHYVHVVGHAFVSRGVHGGRVK